eukprot:6555366-Pyramimonas_sp.AAC.1
MLPDMLIHIAVRLLRRDNYRHMTNATSPLCQRKVHRDTIRCATEELPSAPLRLSALCTRQGPPWFSNAHLTKAESDMAALGKYWQGVAMLSRAEHGLAGSTRPC